MLRDTRTCGFLIFLLPCLTTGIKFQQPKFLTSKVEEKAEIHCSHDDKNYDFMLWYKQGKDSTALDLIGYGYNTGSPSYEENFSTRFTLARTAAEKGSLIIENLTAADTAVYFCAASKHSAVYLHTPVLNLTAWFSVLGYTSQMCLRTSGKPGCRPSHSPFIFTLYTVRPRGVRWHSGLDHSPAVRWVWGLSPTWEPHPDGRLKEALGLEGRHPRGQEAGRSGWSLWKTVIISGSKMSDAPTQDCSSGP
uniref:Ig-like domain-containing protein n=1 Tax=Scleropages formosus TaxID=113540 RepID=A0A8C9TIR8_SCLFO